MKRAGRELEKLVCLLEQILVPEGGIVKSPDIIPDRITGEPREVDVSIWMQVGTAEIFIIIECRDRHGNEDVTWIEQLAKKRDDVKASKAIAVSTSGFSEAAKVKADFDNISLRTVADINIEDIRGWYQVDNMIVNKRRAQFTYIRIIIRGEYEEQVKKELSRICTTKGWSKTACFQHTGNKQQYTLINIWHMLINSQPEIFQDVADDSTITTKTLFIDFTNPENKFNIETGMGLVDIQSIIIIADLWIEKTAVPALRVRKYQSSKQSFVETVEYELNVDEDNYVLQIHRDTSKGSVAFSAVTGDGIPCQIKDDVNH